MRVMRWRRKPNPAALPAKGFELVRRAAEEDRVCALFGPECEQVEAIWNPLYRTNVITVKYRNGRIQTIHPGGRK
jgi:hypothetical protein